MRRRKSARRRRTGGTRRGPIGECSIKVNPVRHRRLSAQAIDRAMAGRHAPCRRPLAGKRGARCGLRRGASCASRWRGWARQVTGVDAAAENVAAASAHAEGVGLDIRYMAGEVAGLDIGTFDLVTSVEVIEHVADKPAFLRDVAARLAPDGLLVMSTPNRTAASRVLLVGAAEAVGYVPRGTHHWDDFVTPEELEALLAEVGLTVMAKRGIAWRPGKGLHLSDDISLNYILSARRV
jgi:2-polyprenyl-6-hydroxyphenyl methylase/3-demethylubiquinone-9 3-methyltransferase